MMDLLGLGDKYVFRRFETSAFEKICTIVSAFENLSASEKLWPYWDCGSPRRGEPTYFVPIPT